MKLREMIEKAIDNQDHKLAGCASDFLRSRGFTYNQTLAFVQTIRPEVTMPEWDALMYEADGEVDDVSS